MKVAIYKRGRYSRSIFVVMSGEEFRHLFGDTSTAYCKVYVDETGTVMALKATGAEDGTKVSETRYGYCVSKSVMSLGLNNLAEFASSTDVTPNLYVNHDGTNAIAFTIPPAFFVSADAEKNTEETTEPAEQAVALPDARFRSLVELVNEMSERLGIRLSVKQNQLFAYRTVEVPV